MRTLLLDAIRGAGFPSAEYAAACERTGLAVFTGNQHNESWAWRAELLESWSEEKLQRLYEQLRLQREESRPNAS